MSPTETFLIVTMFVGGAGIFLGLTFMIYTPQPVRWKSPLKWGPPYAVCTLGALLSVASALGLGCGW